MAGQGEDRSSEGVPELPGPDALLALRVGEAEFAIPASRVQEVLRTPPITRVPATPPAVRGVTSVRGEVVAVLDLGRRLLGADTPAESRLVLVEHIPTGETVGLLLDAVSGLVEGWKRVDEVPPEAAESLPEGSYAGVVEAGAGRLLTLLDLDRVLALEDSAGDEEA